MGTQLPTNLCALEIGESIFRSVTERYCMKVNNPKINNRTNEQDAVMLRDWAQEYGACVRQRAVRQETTMAKGGTLLEYIYQRNCIVLGDKTQIVSDLHNWQLYRLTVARTTVTTTKKTSENVENEDDIHYDPETYAGSFCVNDEIDV